MQHAYPTKHLFHLNSESRYSAGSCHEVTRVRGSKVVPQPNRATVLSTEPYEYGVGDNMHNDAISFCLDAFLLLTTSIPHFPTAPRSLSVLLQISLHICYSFPFLRLIYYRSLAVTETLLAAAFRHTTQPNTATFIFPNFSLGADYLI